MWAVTALLVVKTVFTGKWYVSAWPSFKFSLPKDLWGGLGEWTLTRCNYKKNQKIKKTERNVGESCKAKLKGENTEEKVLKLEFFSGTEGTRGHWKIQQDFKKQFIEKSSRHFSDLVSSQPQCSCSPSKWRSDTTLRETCHEEERKCWMEFCSLKISQNVMSLWCLPVFQEDNCGEVMLY